MKIFIRIILLIAGVSLISLLVSSTARLSIEKYKWKQAKIQNYEIETDYYSPWHFQAYIIVVRNGQVVRSDAYCEKAAIGDEYDQCIVESFEPANYTVEGLFEQAQLARDAEIEFDETYHYPRKIFVSGPAGVYDAGWGLHVISFTVSP